MVDWWFALVVWIPGMPIEKGIVTWGHLKRRSNLMQMIWDDFEVFVRRLLKRWKGFMPPLKKTSGSVFASRCLEEVVVFF